MINQYEQEHGQKSKLPRNVDDATAASNPQVQEIVEKSKLSLQPNSQVQEVVTQSQL
jgi:hypothetical protein